MTISENIASNCSGEKVGLYAYVLIFLLQNTVFTRFFSCDFNRYTKTNGVVTNPVPENMGILNAFNHLLPQTRQLSDIRNIITNVIINNFIIKVFI